jgi:hypothetical protein
VHGFTPTHPVLMMLKEMDYQWKALNEWGSERHVLAWAKGKEYETEAGAGDQPILSP